MWNALGRIPAEGQITDEKRFAEKARHWMEENSERIRLCVVLQEELEQIFASSHWMWGGGGVGFMGGGCCTAKVEMSGLS
jgi:hypothetical protein